jgi:hypothetical protein
MEKKAMSMKKETALLSRLESEGAKVKKKGVMGIDSQ